MTLARLIVHLRAIAAHQDEQTPPASPHLAIATLTGLGVLPTPEARAIRQVLEALAHSHTNPVFDSQVLERFSPLALATLDRLVHAILCGELVDSELNSMLRPFLVRPLN